MSLSRRTRGAGWPLERALFALAGTVAVLSALLAATVSPWFLAFTAFAGVSQWLYAAIGVCPASVVVERVAHLRSAIHTDEERVIFAAGAVMVAVFFTFALPGPLPPKEMGAIPGVAVLLLPVPVMLRLPGRWAWWLPKPHDRLLPDVRFGHA